VADTPNSRRSRRCRSRCTQTDTAVAASSTSEAPTCSYRPSIETTFLLLLLLLLLGLLLCQEAECLQVMLLRAFQR
jgi:hypothetical protein